MMGRRRKTAKTAKTAKTEHEIESIRRGQFHDALERLFDKYGMTGLLIYSRIYNLDTEPSKEGRILLGGDGLSDTWVFTPQGRQPADLAFQTTAADLAVIDRKLLSGEANSEVRKTFRLIKEKAETTNGAVVVPAFAYEYGYENDSQGETTPTGSDEAAEGEVVRDPKFDN